LLDDDLDPVVIELLPAGDGTDFFARGSAAPGINAAAESVGVEVPPSPLETMPDEQLWGRAGLEFAAVAGAPDDVGRVLLEYLSERGR
jgi:hypothetical protein